MASNTKNSLLHFLFFISTIFQHSEIYYSDNIYIKEIGKYYE